MLLNNSSTTSLIYYIGLNKKQYTYLITPTIVPKEFFDKKIMLKFKFNSEILLGIKNLRIEIVAYLNKDTVTNITDVKPNITEIEDLQSNPPSNE